MTGIINC